MLKHQLLSIFLTVLFFNSSAQFILNQDNINADQVTFSMETFVDRALQHFDDESNQVAGYQIVFSKNGQLYHQESRGWAIHPDDHSGDGVTMENTTRFDVASVSKWLCAIVMANVMDQNNIDWDDSVGPYLPPSWPAQMAPEYFNQSSDCYLTFGKLMRHQTCLGWSGDNSGPLGGDKNEILDALGPASLNEAEFGEYQNGNFAFARYLIAEILVGGFMNENSSNYDDLVKAAYLTALKNYVFDPLGLSTPSSIADFNDFYDGDVPHRYAFPFNPNQTCDGVLGVDYSPSSFDFLGSTGAIISSIELAAIMAYFVHDDSGTVIPAGIRDEMLANGYGLSQSEWNGGITTYGQYYRKGGLLSKTCGEDEDFKRGYRSSVVAYPNGVEVVVLSNSRVDFLGDLAREWEDSWVKQQCSFVHTTTENSVTNHFSMIDNPAMNFDEDRLVFASPIYRPYAGNISPTGVWYNGEKWGVFNQTLFPMPVGSQWAIFSVPEDYPLAFKHMASDNNTLNNITVIDHPLLNDNEDAELIVTQNWGSAPGVFNPHNIGVYYTGTKWTILNLDFEAIPEGAGFNVYIHPKAISEEVVSQPLGNTGELGIPSFNDPTADDPILVTNVYASGLPFNDSPVGTWFYDGDWFLYNTDFDAMNNGTTVNYAHLSDIRVDNTSSIALAYVIDEEQIALSPSGSDTLECLDSEPFPEISTCSFCYDAQMIQSDNYSFFYNPSRVRITYFNPLSEEFFDNFSHYRHLEDDEPPVLMNVPSDIIGNCDVGDPLQVTANDNCEAELTYQDEVTGEDCDFIIERTWTAVDLAGNSSVATQFIYSGSGADQDEDGFDVFLDCDDNDPFVNPAALELCDGIDNDCDSQIDENCVDCASFLEAPIDLSKSFDPVSGVQDRVQLKWYKDSPQIRYTDEDAAMCDIKFWKKRDLDPTTGNPIGPAYVDPDTVIIQDVKKVYPDGSPREIFKWPIKYRANGINNDKRAEPNIRYEWQVRCECSHLGSGPESPWSTIKIFNTPDFDPSTGMYMPPPENEGFDKSISQDHTISFQVFPNPLSRERIQLRFSSPIDESVKVQLISLTGKVEMESNERVKENSLWLDIGEDIKSGVYLIRVIGQDDIYSRTLMIQR